MPTQTEPMWCIMPVLAGPEMSEAALSDLLAQSVPVRVLIVNQGVDDLFRERLERLAEQHAELYLWHHVPPLPSLSATWNRALDFAWESGAEEALVVNNDCRFHRDMVRLLQHARAYEDALFVSAVGVTADQFDPSVEYRDVGLPKAWFADGGPHLQKGGPDFSCYLISKVGHQQYRFDEAFVPAFCEDLDMHRRYLLGGDGSRIFSVNLPYLHLASQTLKSVSPEQRQRIEHQIETVSRAHYLRAWGGPVNAETYLRKGDPSSAVTDGTATTPHLQAHPPVVCAVQV